MRSTMAHQNNVAKWTRFFRDMATGKIPTNKDFYVVDTDTTTTNINSSRPEGMTYANNTVAREKARLKYLNEKRL